MPPKVCRTRACHSETFGRVVRLREAVRAGEDVLCEAPLVLVDQPRQGSYAEDLLARYNQLTEEQRAFVATLAPHSEMPMPRVAASLPPAVLHFGRALKANAHIFGERDQLALFENITLAPHSCDHNAAYYDEPGAGLGRLYAIRDLEPGELLTISYIGTRGSVQLWPAWQRREYLRRGFGFECRCSRCEAAGGGQPSARSVEKLAALTKLQHERSVSDPRVFMARAERHLKECEGVPREDDGPFHLLGALDLLGQFHSLLSQQDEEHLLRAVQLLAWKYALVVQHASPLEDEGLGGIFRYGAARLVMAEEAKTRPVLQRLWEHLGGQLRVVCGEHNPEFKGLCHVFGQPKGAPSTAEVLRELAAVRPCAACGVAAVLGCQRCQQEVYCSTPCQRVCWPKHKALCAARAAGQ